MSDQPSKFSLWEMFRQLLPLFHTRGNDDDEHIEDEEGPLPPSLSRPPEQENVQILLEESGLKERRTQLIDHLDSIYREAYDCGKPFFDSTTYDKLKIRCETLDLENDGEYGNGAAAPNFFVPLPSETIKKHQIITRDDRDIRVYQSYEYILDRTEAGDASPPLSYGLMWHFHSFRRNGITDGRGRLIDITEWKEAYVPHFVSVTRNILANVSHFSQRISRVYTGVFRFWRLPAARLLALARGLLDGKIHPCSSSYVYS
jgi:hypothetical protein